MRPVCGPWEGADSFAKVMLQSSRESVTSTAPSPSLRLFRPVNILFRKLCPSDRFIVRRRRHRTDSLKRSPALFFQSQKMEPLKMLNPHFNITINKLAKNGLLSQVPPIRAAPESFRRMTGKT